MCTWHENWVHLFSKHLLSQFLMAGTRTGHVAPSLSGTLPFSQRPPEALSSLWLCHPQCPASISRSKLANCPVPAMRRGEGAGVGGKVCPSSLRADRAVAVISTHEHEARLGWIRGSGIICEDISSNIYTHQSLNNQVNKMTQPVDISRTVCG